MNVNGEGGGGGGADEPLSAYSPELCEVAKVFSNKAGFPFGYNNSAVLNK